MLNQLFDKNLLKKNCVLHIILNPLEEMHWMFQY